MNIASARVGYINTRVVPLLKMNILTKLKTDQPWTNNNCESINHVIKQATQWKSRSMVDLIEILHNVVHAQYQDIKRAFVRLGNFQLTNAAVKFQMNPCVWDRKSPKQQTTFFRRFLKHITPIRGNTIVSSDGCLGVVIPPNGSKKPEQRNRKRAHKTTSRKAENI